MKILLYRLLDFLESDWRRKLKVYRETAKWGANWQNMTRSGRVYSRVEYHEATTIAQDGFHVLRAEPGWEWTCPNCKTYSIVTASMMPAILEEWEVEAARMARAGYRAPFKPTAATAGCTNCNFRPGAPE